VKWSSLLLQLHITAIPSLHDSFSTLHRIFSMASLFRTLPSSSNPSKIPLFLAPAFARPAVTVTQASNFSTSTAHPRASAVQKQAKIKAKTSGKPNWAPQARPKIDKNKKRGVSAIRRTGPRSTRGLWEYPLPVPVAREQTELSVDYPESQDHGLWGFFDTSRQALLQPEEEVNHGGFLKPGDPFERE
jgi:hypothetical protein